MICKDTKDCILLIVIIIVILIRHGGLNMLFKYLFYFFGVLPNHGCSSLFLSLLVAIIECDHTREGTFGYLMCLLSTQLSHLKNIVARLYKMRGGQMLVSKNVGDLGLCLPGMLGSDPC